MTISDDRRGHPSRISTGRNTYGVENIRIVTNNEGADLYIGSFCSIAANQLVFLGGNHRSDWITTFPFGHISKEIFNVSAVEGHGKGNGDIIIGNDVLLGPGVSIIASNHGSKSSALIRIQSDIDKDIKIGNDVWIGAKSTIMSGVKIGNGAVIGATATVTKDVPPYAIVVGNPGKIVKYRFTEKQIDLLLQISWWNWDEEKIKRDRNQHQVQQNVSPRRW
jgi:acetyltransferase-like isoleucine patch superfamily enzyme